MITKSRQVQHGMPAVRGERFAVRVSIALAVTLLALIPALVVMSSFHPVTFGLGRHRLFLIGHPHEGEIGGICLDLGYRQVGIDVNISGFHWSATYYSVQQGTPVIMGEPEADCVII